MNRFFWKKELPIHDSPRKVDFDSRIDSKNRESCLPYPRWPLGKKSEKKPKRNQKVGRNCWSVFRATPFGTSFPLCTLYNYNYVQAGEKVHYIQVGGVKAPDGRRGWRRARGIAASGSSKTPLFSAVCTFPLFLQVIKSYETWLILYFLSMTSFVVLVILFNYFSCSFAIFRKALPVLDVICTCLS